MKVILLVLFYCAIVHYVDCEGIDSDTIDLCSTTSSYTNYTKSSSQNCGCKNESCVRKCCQKGYYLYHEEDPYENIFTSVCIKNDNDSFEVPIYKKRQHLYNLTLNDSFLIGMLDCKNDMWQYFKMNNSNKMEKFYIQDNGNLYYPHSKHKFYDNSRYCIDEQDRLTAFLCYTAQSVDKPVGNIIKTIGMIISLPFFLLTFIVFATVPNGSVHRRALMFFSLSMFMAYSLLVTVQLYNKIFNFLACQTLGYSIILFFMSSFFWMNILSFDIWFAFGGLVKFSREPKKETKRFIFYCLYAWGLPVLHILMIILLGKYGDPNSPYYPGVGRFKCFLDENYPTFLYFYCPLTVIIGLNIILFLLTSVKINKIKRDKFSIHRWSLKRYSYEYDKKKYYLYIKLLLVMGITWSLEIVSWAIQMGKNDEEESFIWYLSDLCNALYGLLLFSIFVYNKTVWKTFKKRVCRLFSCFKATNNLEEQENDGRETPITPTHTSTIVLAD